MIKIDAKYSITGNLAITATSPVPIISAGFYIIKVEDPNDIQTYNLLDTNTDLTSVPGYVAHTITHGNSWIYTDIKKSGIYIIIVKTNTDIAHQILKIVTKLTVFSSKIFNETKKGANDGSISVILEGGNSPYTYILCPNTPQLQNVINSNNFNPSIIEDKFILKEETINSPVISIFNLVPNNYILFVIESERTDAGYSSYIQLPFSINNGINSLIPFNPNNIKLIDPSHINYSDGVINFVVESGIGLVNFRLLLTSNQNMVAMSNKKVGDKVYFDNLPANNYTLVAIDEKGNTEQIQLELNPSSVSELTGTALAYSPSDILLNNGYIDLTMLGGLTPYTISLYEIIPLRLRTITDNKLIQKETTSNNSFTFNNLSPNSYLVTIKESSERNPNELKFELNIPSINTNTLNVSVNTLAPESIDGKGLATINISGGNRDQNQNVQVMIYEFDGVNRLFKDSQTTNKNIINWRLLPGDYQVIVKDLISQKSANFTIPDYNYTKMSFDTPLVQPIWCLSSELGGISLQILDGIEPFTWTFDEKIDKSYLTLTNNNRDLFVNNLPIGKYNFSVKDKAGDEIQIQLPIDFSPLVLNLNLNILNIKNINEEEDLGWFNFIVNNGCYPYTYTLSKIGDINFNTVTQKSKLENGVVLPHTFNNLTKGDYLLTITDSNNNSISESIKIVETIYNYKLIKSTFSNSTNISNNNGIINIEIEGGVSPYSYFIDDLNGPFTSGPILTPLTTFNFSSLTPSKYKVSITDSTLPSGITIDFETPNYDFNTSLQDNDLIFYGFTNETGIQTKDGSITISPTFLSKNLLVYLINMKDGQKVTQSNPLFINPIKYPEQVGATWQNLAHGNYMILALKKDTNVSTSYIYQKEYVTITKYPVPQIVVNAYKTSDTEWNIKTGSIYYNLTTTGIGPYRIEVINTTTNSLVYRETVTAITGSINNLDSGNYIFKISDLGYFNDPDLPNSNKIPVIVNNIIINKLFDIINYTIKDNDLITIELSPVGSGQVSTAGFSVYLLSKTDYPSNPTLSSPPYIPNHAIYITPITSPTLSRIIVIEADAPDDYWLMVIDEANQKVVRELTIYPNISATWTAINPTVEGNLTNGAIYFTASGGSSTNYIYELTLPNSLTPISNTNGEFTGLSTGTYNIKIYTNIDVPYTNSITLIDNSISCSYTGLRNIYQNVTSMYFNDSNASLGNSINEDFWIYTELWSRIPVKFEEKYALSGSMKLELIEDNGSRTGYFLHNFINSNETEITPRFLFWQYYFSLLGLTNYKANLKYGIHCPIPKSIIDTPPSLNITDVKNNTAFYLGKHTLLNFNTLPTNDLLKTDNGLISGNVTGGTAPYIVELYESVEDYYVDKNNKIKSIYHKNQNRDKLVKSITLQNNGDNFTFGDLEGFYYNSTLEVWEKKFYYIKVIDSSHTKLSSLSNWNSSYRYIGDIIHTKNNINQYPGRLSAYSDKLFIENKSPYLSIEAINNPTPVNNQDGVFRIYLNNYSLLENSNLQSLKLFKASYNPIQTCCVPSQQLVQTWTPTSEPNQFYTDVSNISSIDNLSFVLNYQRSGSDYYITLTPFTLNEVIFDKVPLAINNFDNQSLIGDNTIRTYMNSVLTSNNNWIDRNNLYQRNSNNKLISTSIIDSNNGLIQLSINDKASSLVGLNVTFQTYNSANILLNTLTQLYNGVSINYEYKPTIDGLYKVKITAGTYIIEQWYNISNLNQELN